MTKRVAAVVEIAHPWQKDMVKKNNKGRVAGSGIVSLVRKERYKLACQERDRLLAEAKAEEDKAKAYLVQKEWQRKPLERLQGAVGLQPAAVK